MGGELHQGGIAQLLSRDRATVFTADSGHWCSCRGLGEWAPDGHPEAVMSGRQANSFSTDELVESWATALLAIARQPKTAKRCTGRYVTRSVEMHKAGLQLTRDAVGALQVVGVYVSPQAIGGGIGDMHCLC